MNPNPSSTGGWVEALRRIGGLLAALGRSRFELFTVEWQEEKLRLLNLLVWLGVAAVLGAAGLFLGLLALAYWLWTIAGYAGLIGLTLGTLAAAVGILGGIRKKIRTGRTPFAQTVAEFQKDEACLRTGL